MPQDPTTTSVAAAAATVGRTGDPRGHLDHRRDPDAAAAAAPAVSAPPRPPDVVNHGEYVSRVARETPSGPDHGKIVAAAAESDCGKPTAPPASAPAAAASTGHGSSDLTPHPARVTPRAATAEVTATATVDRRRRCEPRGRGAMGLPPGGPRRSRRATVGGAGRVPSDATPLIRDRGRGG